MNIAGYFGIQLRTALEVPRWAFAFYLRHLLLVAGISLVPAAQRVVGVLWAPHLPAAVNLILESITIAARILLVVLIIRLVFSHDGREAARTTSPPGRAGVWAFLWSRWPSVIIQLVLLGCLAAVFDFVPEQVIAPQVPETLRRAYWAVLLASKNPTVIAFTMVWLIAAARQMTLYPEPLPPLGRPPLPAERAASPDRPLMQKPPAAQAPLESIGDR